jgi:hypothetical protein
MLQRVDRGGAHMLDHDRDLNMDLGRTVRRRTDPSSRLGCVVAVTLTPPPAALVRWRGAEATFVPLEELEDVTPAPR